MALGVAVGVAVFVALAVDAAGEPVAYLGGAAPVWLAVIEALPVVVVVGGPLAVLPVPAGLALGFGAAGLAALAAARCRSRATARATAALVAARCRCRAAAARALASARLRARSWAVLARWRARAAARCRWRKSVRTVQVWVSGLAYGLPHVAQVRLACGAIRVRRGLRLRSIRVTQVWVARVGVPLAAPPAAEHAHRHGAAPAVV